MYANIWYVAARSEELTDKPLKVQMLGCDFVLFRDKSGTAVCLSNVCPHRGASLAQGRCNDDGAIKCPYHGWQFDGSGKCTEIISRRDEDPQDVVKGVKIDAYPTQEKYGFIWTFLGDDPDSASQLPVIGEFDDPSFRSTTHSETWQTNYHWAKFSNLDLVHLPVVHGIKFRNQDNPFAPPPFEISENEFGFAQCYYPSAGIRAGGEWEKLREGNEAKQVESRLVFDVAGFMLNGRVEIGGVGSNMYNVFYEFSTPIDDQTTAMHYIFFRNFMLDPAIDAEHLKRNLANVHQDKNIAESQRPRIAPVGPDPTGYYTKDEDTQIGLYWRILGRLRERGWQIDRSSWSDMARDGRYRVIPSPARRKVNFGWAHDSVPFFPKGSAFPVAAEY